MTWETTEPMAKAKKTNDTGANLGFEAKLWAVKLRNNMDAAEYKHVVLGLIFLKYISDAFDEHHQQLEKGTADPDSDWYVKDAKQRYTVLSQCGEAFLVNTERTISAEGLENSSTKMVAAFSTIVVARGAKTSRMAMFGDQIAMNQTCYALRSRLQAHFFLYCQMRHVICELVHSAHGSVFDTITTRTFETTPVLLPDGELASRFHAVVSPLMHQVLANQRLSHSLTALRDALLPKLLSEEIRVPEAERRVGEVL